MGVYLHGKFEVSRVIPMSFRKGGGGNFTPSLPLQNKPQCVNASIWDKLKFWKSLSKSGTFNLENVNLLSNPNVNPQN